MKGKSMPQGEQMKQNERGVVGTAFILWLLGVPLSVIVLLWLVGILK
jgi:hypothetical protein